MFALILGLVKIGKSDGLGPEDSRAFASPSHVEIASGLGDFTTMIRNWSILLEIKL
jgi:hypothetical protein